MRLSVICFTKNGYEQMKKLKDICDSEKKSEISCFCRCSALKEICDRSTDIKYVDYSLDDWTKRQFEEKNAVLFISAVGIAVRAIAGCVKNKLTDSPVIVMDDRARFVISLLSGHVGGANEIASEIADIMNAVPVITTSTDINSKFAIDMFAKKNGLAIYNKNGIAKVSAKVLENKKIRILIDRNLCSIDKENAIKLAKKHGVITEMTDNIQNGEYEADVFIGNASNLKNGTFNVKAKLCLLPEIYVIGIGCRRGKTKEEIDAFVGRELLKLNIDKRQIKKITSIDIKKDEEGLILYASELEIPFETFSAEELNKIDGKFSESEFVRSKVGVDCVSERAALAGCNNSDGLKRELVLSKQAENGITLAIAKTEWRLTAYE